MEGSSEAPPVYMDEDKCIHTCLLAAQLVNQIKNGGFEVDHTHINENMMLNVLDISSLFLHGDMIREGILVVGKMGEMRSCC